MEEKERIQKYLAECGVASRRKIEAMIIQKRIKVNGKLAKLGEKVNSADEILVDNVKISTKQLKEYYILNKPLGYVSTAKDQFNRPSVIEIIKTKNKIVPVGRLDMYTTGLLILTNDGEYLNKVIHPKNEIEKEYYVSIKGIIDVKRIKELEKGIILEDNFKTSNAKVKILKIDKEKNISRISLIIHEGHNRQVRKMVNKIGYKVLALHRIRIGNIKLENIKLGEYIKIDKKKANKVFN